MVLWQLDESSPNSTRWSLPYPLSIMIQSQVRSSVFLAAIVGVFAIVSASGQASTGSSSTLQSAQSTKGKESSPATPARLPVCPQADVAAVEAPHHASGTHKVTLSWKASPPSSNAQDNAVGYCVYRRKEKKEGKNAVTQNPIFAGRERINLVPVPGTTCVDDDVDDDATYSYIVTAVNANGIPSSPSNEAPAPIPAEKPTGSVHVDAPSCRGTFDAR